MKKCCKKYRLYKEYKATKSIYAVIIYRFGSYIVYVINKNYVISVISVFTLQLG